MQETIYNYVINHLDEHGRFTETNLCDAVNESIPGLLGSEDAFYYSTNMESAVKLAKKLVENLRKYMREPDLINRSSLSELLNGQIFATYCDPFIDAFPAENMNIVVLDLAKHFFYNAQNREQVKFALLLFGLYGMKNILENEPKLWQDMLKLAHCEEFTFPFLLACRVSYFTPQSAVWELIRCTNGWGKVFAISDCKCRDIDDQLWLLENGPDISVEYPPLSIKFIQETHLEDLLGEELTYAQYKSAIIIVGNYLIMLNQTPIKSIEASFNISSINLYKLLTLILEQAKQHISHPEDILDMISYVETLRTLAEAHNLRQLSQNQCQLLIADFENIIYSKDMTSEITENLIKDEQVNYTLCDLAVELEMDIWPELFDYWKKHPQETALFPYLLSYENDNRPHKVIKLISRHLPEYSIEANSLLVPLRYLAQHPGEGEAIICSALTSIYDLPRVIACDTLEDWPPEFISTAIHDALIEGLKLSNNAIVTERLDCLLQGRKFDLKKFMEAQQDKK